MKDAKWQALAPLIDECRRVKLPSNGTVKLSSLGWSNWQAEDDAGTEFKLPQQLR
jgi:hypothetical protein